MGYQYSGFTAQVPDSITGQINTNISYPIAVLSHSIYVTKHIPELLMTGSGVEKKAVFSAIADVRGLHFLIRAGIPHHFRQDYIDKGNEFIKDLTYYATKSDRIEQTIPKLYDFLDLIGDNFGLAGVLPAQEEQTDLGTKETQIKAENQKILRVAIFLLQKHGSKLKDLIKEGQPVKLLSPKQKLFNQAKEKSFDEIVGTSVEIVEEKKDEPRKLRRII